MTLFQFLDDLPNMFLSLLDAFNLPDPLYYLNGLNVHPVLLAQLDLSLILPLWGIAHELTLTNLLLKASQLLVRGVIFRSR